MPGRYIPGRVKQAVIERAFRRCEYCQSWMKNAIHPFHIDHVLPLDEMGETSLDNLALSCGGCNSYKTNRTTASDPVTKAVVPLCNPRIDKWSEHFAWSEDYLQVIGLTQTGRATVETLP